MALSIGLIGLPNAGKSTLYNALTSNYALIADYPFATIDPNIGIVSVPDDRLQRLANLYKSPKVIHATIKFIDIAGLVRGASKGEGIGNQFLSHIRNTDLLIQVVGAFRTADDQEVIDNAKEAVEIINTELALADLQTIDNRLIKLAKESKADPKMKALVDHLEVIKTRLNKGMNIFKDVDLNSAGLQLITLKPMIYLFNVSESDITNDVLKSKLSKIVNDSPLFVSAKLESEVSMLKQEDAAELLNSYGQTESSLNALVTQAYDLLGLQSFITAGEKEVRAWTIKKGATAKEAAGVIHKDFERGFIAADIVKYQDLKEFGSLANARSKGKVRSEGKAYIMQEDDVVIFKFNV